LQLRRLYKRGYRFNILSAEDSGLSMREDGCDLEAAGALDIKEVAVRRLDQSLELVRALLMFSSWMKQIELHNFQKRNTTRRISK